MITSAGMYAAVICCQVIVSASFAAAFENLQLFDRRPLSGPLRLSYLGLRRAWPHAGSNPKSKIENPKLQWTAHLSATLTAKLHRHRIFKAAFCALVLFDNVHLSARPPR